MKKRLLRVCGVLLAIVAAFSACGCGNSDPKVENAGDAIGGAATEMAKQDRFAVKTTATLTSPGLKNYKLGGFTLGADTVRFAADTSVKKTDGGYNFSADGSIAADGLPVTLPVQAVKIGETLYTKLFNGGWTTREATQMNVSIDAAAQKVQQAVDGFEYGGFTEEADGYALTARADFGASLTAVRDFILLHANDPLSQWVTSGESAWEKVQAALVAEGVGAAQIGKAAATLRALIAKSDKADRAAAILREQRADATATVGSLWNAWAELFDENVRNGLSYIGDPNAVEGAALGLTNLATYAFPAEENYATARLTLNRDLTVKNIAAALYVCATAGEEKTPLAQIALVTDNRFSYKGMKPIVQPV